MQRSRACRNTKGSAASLFREIARCLRLHHGLGVFDGDTVKSGSGESKNVEEGDKVREVIGGQSTQPLKAEEVFGCYFE